MTEKMNSRTNKEIQDMIFAIHDSPYRIVLTITGGGTEAIGELLRHGRGSDTILEAIIPYSREALIDLIGKEPQRYASMDTAKEMAMAAYMRALYLDPNAEDQKDRELIGIGVTCKLARTTNEREGREHEIHFAYQSYDRTGVSSVLLKDITSREEQEKAVAEHIIEKIYMICHYGRIDGQRALSNMTMENSVESEIKAHEAVAELLLRTLKNINSGQRIEPLKVDMGISNNRTRVVLSGSFNPFHKNHFEMIRIASERINGPVDLEISLANVDKPPIDHISLDSRVSSIMENYDGRYMGNIYLTNAPLFADKAILFPGSVFIIGMDTLNRLFNIKYYRKDENTDELIEHFREYGIRFMVFQRKGSEVSENIDIPDICEIVPLETYMDDGTSSTLIREQN
ncbi:nucleotidyl transferase family protein [Methanolobus profundi]|nr:hypothetical protein [Methanolobus profundi]